MPEIPEIVVYEGSGQWSAAYVDGILLHAGDHSNNQEAVYERLGVIVRQSDDFLCGGDGGRDQPVPKDLHDVQKYTSLREARKVQAYQLRAAAADMIQQAEELENA